MFRGKPAEFQSECLDSEVLAGYAGADALAGDHTPVQPSPPFFISGYTLHPLLPSLSPSFLPSFFSPFNPFHPFLLFLFPNWVKTGRSLFEPKSYKNMRLLLIFFFLCNIWQWLKTFFFFFFGCHNQSGWYWHLVNRSQECCCPTKHTTPSFYKVSWVLKDLIWPH